MGGTAPKEHSGLVVSAAELNAMTAAQRARLALSTWSRQPHPRRNERFDAAFLKVQHRVGELADEPGRAFGALRAVVRVNCYLAEAAISLARERREGAASGTTTAIAAARRILSTWGLRY